MNSKPSVFKKIVSVILSFAFVLPASLFLIGDSGKAEAMASLPYVEEIKQSGGAFKILEIVPDKSQGSIGYLINDREPCSDWVTKAGQQENRSARMDYINSLFNSLTSSGILGSGDSAPLESKGSYTEKYPWENHDNFSEMPLSHWETVNNVNGTLTPSSNGDYSPHYTYSLADGGSYLQIITGLSTDSAEAEDSYYYNISFEKITGTTSITENSLIYAKTEETPDLSPDIDGTVVPLKCLGLFGAPNFPGINVDTDSYIAKPVGSPKTAQDTEHPYRAYGDEFRAAAAGETGYFKQTLSAYKYVGQGGEYTFKANEGSQNYNLMYNTVFYSGGYANKNWFLRHVFDWQPEKDEAMPQTAFAIRTVTGNEVSADTAAQFDLIILSGGTDGNYNIENDLSSAVSSSIRELCTATSTKKGSPIIIDNRLLDGSLNINTLATNLAGTSTPHVTGNVYCAQYPLVNQSFTTNFDAKLYSANGTPFHPVYKEIQDENLLRRISGVEQLPLEVNPARAVRSVINSAGRRTLDDKNVISVLEIEPSRGKELNKNTVLRWLGYPPNSTEVGVSITSMSTAEFIGKIDDIKEKYDLVYIGSNLEGFKTKDYFGKPIPDYYDDNMDGLIYSNIGDLVISGGESGFSMSGLLDRDYSSNTFSRNGKTYNKIRTGTSSNWYNTSRTFRYSGNDLTKSKMEQLQAFANAGYPVIVANDLMQGIKITNNSSTVGLCRFGFLNIRECIYRPVMEFDSSSFSLTVRLESVSSHYGYTNNAVVTAAAFNLYKRGKNGAPDTLVSSNQVNGTSSIFDLSQCNYNDEYYCTIDVENVRDSIGYEHDINRVFYKEKTETFALSKGLNELHIDNSSHMYEFLQSAVSLPNVMSVKEALADGNAARKYVNIPKPKISFSTVNGKLAYPTEYSRDDNGKVTSLEPKNGSYHLEYRFKIQNRSDPVPTQTQYYCNLFIDGNGDGLYTNGTNGPNELLSDIVIHEWDPVKNRAGAIVKNGELETGVEYYVSRKLPGDMIGLIPWKLEIAVYNGDGSAGKCTSYRNYTHIPVPTDENGVPLSEKIPKIEILQVNTSRSERSFWGVTVASGIDLEAQMREVSSGGYWSEVTKKRYAGIYGKLIADISNDFKITIKTIRANTLDHSSTWVHNGTTYSNINDYLNSFDMVILGFDDCYQELSQESATAVANYIKTGKATLFTHDCTSFFFLPFEDYPTENSGVIGKIPNYVYSSTNIIPSFSMFGYRFNMTIRDAVGLDRYGVTSQKYGLTKKSIPDIPKSGIVSSNAYLTMNESQKNALLEDGYSIAYKPGSGRTETVAETQGLTKGVLMHYYQGAGKPTSDTYSTNFETTSTVSQVNEGKITSYPYNVNTAAFKGSGDTNTMPVAQTHFQYQQLNMNSDDIVVWYCLSGGTFDYLPNDVINSYYLYSRGNVTYSGCGHTTSPINQNEAKLFINTMIASYRTSKSAPEVCFTDSTGMKTLNNYLIPRDETGMLEISGADNNIRSIYFTVNDTNFGEKTLKASFSCADTSLEGITIYNAETREELSAGESLRSGVVYCINFDEVWTKLPSDVKSGIGNGIKFFITVDSTVDGHTKKGTDYVTLRQFSLSPLS